MSKEGVEAWLDAHMARAEKRAKCKPSHTTWAKRRYWLLSLLSCFYDWAVEAGHVPDIPVRKISRPRLRRTMSRPMSDEDLVRAVAMAEPQMRCMILLGALQGLRCQEIAGLDRQDVMEADMLLQITQGKGGHERTMLLHRTVLAALQAMPMPPGGTLFRRGWWPVPRDQRVARREHLPAPARHRVDRAPAAPPLRDERLQALAGSSSDSGAASPTSSRVYRRVAIERAVDWHHCYELLPGPRRQAVEQPEVP